MTLIVKLCFYSSFFYFSGYSRTLCNTFAYR